MRCPNCGTQLEAGARFCGACGARLDAKPVPAAAPVIDGAKTLVAGEPIFHKPAPAPVARAAIPAPVAAPRPAPVAAPAAAPYRPNMPRPAPVDPFLGKTLNNRYLVESKLGEGGFGAVYRGKQVAIGRQVALKLLRPDMARDQNIVARFRREGAVACNLRDAHTITTYDFDQTAEGILYIAMELLEGKSLHEVFHDEAPLPWTRVASVLEQMCSSLGEAHAQGIVHRDLKPENVYLEARPGDPDFVKILDFGIAKIVSGDIGGGSQSPQLTATGQTLGTLEYMSPEQLMGKQLDGRSDVYAMGVVAYELLTGHLPFPDAKGPAELIAAQLKKTPPAASLARPDRGIPPGIDAILLKMLEKNRDKRYADVHLLRAHLNHVLSTGGTVPPDLAAAQAASPAPAATPRPQPAPSPAHSGPVPGPAGGYPPGAVSFRPQTPAPQAQAGHRAPTPVAPSTQEVIAAATGGSRLWLWIVIAAVILGGGAAGVYFALLR